MSIEIFTNQGIKIEYKSFIFSGGEVSVKLKQQRIKCKSLFIVAFLKNSDDIMLLLNLTDALRRGYGFTTPLHLQLDYCPYARQDRVCDEGESFSLQVFTSLINSLNFTGVVITDPHSDVAPALINNCRVRPLEDVFDESNLYYQLEKVDYIISPDAGANKKVFKISQEYGVPMIRADKLRDLSNGQIIETIVYAEDLTDKRVLIIDDICDGGRTFVELSKQLINKGAKVDLYVTYGIFSKGKEVLYEAGIENVYCPYEF